MDDPSDSRQARWRGYGRRLADKVRRVIPFAGGMLAALAALYVYNYLVPAPQPLTEQQVGQVVAQAMASATPPPAYSASVYAAVRPSLVLIESTGVNVNGKAEDGLGSGVVISAEGDILTCLHVVDGAASIQVIFADGTQSSAAVVAEQPEHDIAVLRADQPSPQLAPAILGNPNAMNVGDEVFAVGNPFGLYSSISAGVVSGFDRSFRAEANHQKLEGLIQIDSAVNPGNSGGPLLDRAGHVVGIVVGILNPTDQEVFIGIGFAVPITIASGAAGGPQY